MQIDSIRRSPSWVKSSIITVQPKSPFRFYRPRRYACPLCLLGASKLPVAIKDVTSLIVDGYPEHTEGFAFCLSEKGDLLSQWRAYSHDATGISIGFDLDILGQDFGSTNFGSQFFNVVRVSYGEDGARERLAPIVAKLVDAFSTGQSIVRIRDGLSTDAAIQRFLSDEQREDSIFEVDGDLVSAEAELTKLLNILSPLHFEIYNIKPATFSEELEWRILRFRHKAAFSEVEYFAHDASVRPFIQSMIQKSMKHAIREVILGPKHRSNYNWMTAFLASKGLSHVRVLRSAITSYR